MIRLKAIITGSNIHGVGYRVLLVNKALSLGIDNFNTFNTYLNNTQAVIAIIEADEETIKEFKLFVTSTTPDRSDIENISFEEYKNIVPPIERVMQSFQMEQWGKGIPILLQISDTLNTNTLILKENMSILKDFKTETNENFSDLKDIMLKHDIDTSERLLIIKKEISGIKERLASVESAVYVL